MRPNYRGLMGPALVLVWALTDFADLEVLLDVLSGYGKKIKHFKKKDFCDVIT